MATLEQLLRLGCLPEAAAVYEAVARLCESSPSKTLELVADIERAYRACEQSYADVEGAIQDYKDSDGTPAEIRHKWKP